MPAPQALRNWRTGSTRGLSVFLVITWAIGDVLKIAYALARDAPVQFVACGAAQVLLDAVVLAQIVYYGRLGGGTSASAVGAAGSGGLLGSGAHAVAGGDDAAATAINGADASGVSNSQYAPPAASHRRGTSGLASEAFVEESSLIKLAQASPPR